MQGKTFCESIVSKYTKILADNQHELFLENKKFTNTALHMFHTNKLAEAGAPLKVQQESLGQNTHFYKRGADDLERKKKVADIVCGERATWHLPASAKSSVNSIGNPSSFSCPAPSLDLQEHTLPGTNKRLKFSFQSANANIQFEYDFCKKLCLHVQTNLPSCPLCSVLCEFVCLSNS